MPRVEPRAWWDCMRNTYVWDLTVSEDATMIDYILELVDSKTAADFLTKYVAAVPQAQ